MATFKVGQRVRNIYNGPDACRDLPFGAEGVVTGLGGHVYPNGYMVKFDGISPPLFGGAFNCREDTLAPLTDPKADAFLESIKKLAREPAPCRTLTELLEASYQERA